VEPDAPRERVRVRKRKRSRRPRVRSPWLLIPLGALVLLVIAGGLLARDVQRVRTSLLAAQSSLLEVREAAGGIDVDAAAAALARADADLAEARSRSGGPLWSVAARMPVAGDSITVTREVVRTASALVDVAEQAVTEGSELLGDGLDVTVEDGRLDLGPLHAARELLAGLPLERLTEARARLAAAEPRWAPGQVLEGRADTLMVASEVIGSVERGRALLSALPTFLGEQGQRRYFLGVQTPAELRGTGGLIGYYAVLEAEAGRLELAQSGVYDTFEDLEDDAPTTGTIGQLAGDVTDGVPVSDEYAARYAHTASPAFFSNVNVDPDLPTTAPIMLGLFEKRTGERLDGVVLVDPVAMEMILRAIGEGIEIPSEVPQDAGLGEALPADRFAEFAMIDVYEQLGSDRSRDRKLALRATGDAVFARVVGGSWDGVAVSRALGDAAAGRHVQLYSRDGDEQEAFARVGVAGRLAATEGADLLAVTANNAVGGKQDVHLGHRVAAEVQLDDPRRDDEGHVTLQRRTDLRVEVDNPLPSEGMDEYIIGNCLVGTEGSGCFDGPPGVNRTWFTAWAPGAARLASPADGQALSGVRATEFRGLSAFDRYLETPSQDVAGFDLAWEGRAPASTDAGDLLYELTWWSQAKAIPTLLDVTVAAPVGWRVAKVEVSGGGSGQGLGAFGQGQVLTAEVDGDGRAHVTGTVTADTQLRVRMVGDDLTP
jgi:hypothetical protein